MEAVAQKRAGWRQVVKCLYHSTQTSKSNRI